MLRNFPGLSCEQVGQVGVKKIACGPCLGRREISKDPHPQDKIQHLDLTKDPRPLYYKTPPCVVYHKNVRSKAVFCP